MVKYKIRGYTQARDIIEGGFVSEDWMRSVVSSVTGDGEYAGTLPYNRLRGEMHKIIGIARKVLDSREQAKERKRKRVVQRFLDFECGIRDS